MSQKSGNEYITYIMTIVKALLATMALAATSVSAEQCPTILEPFVADTAYTGTMRLSNPDDATVYKWYFNFCKDAGSPCPNGANACQANDDFAYGFGRSLVDPVATTQANGNETDIIVSFAAFRSIVDGNLRSGRIIVTCGEEIKVTDASQVTLATETQYTLKLHHPKACAPKPTPTPTPTPAPSNKKAKKGLGFGSVALIIILVLVVVYVVGGFLFGRFKQEKEGIEAFPNIDFWRELPGLVADGCRFIGSKTCFKSQASSADYDQI